jgi:hypothetical protein
MARTKRGPRRPTRTRTRPGARAAQARRKPARPVRRAKPKAKARAKVTRRPVRKARRAGKPVAKRRIARKAARQRPATKAARPKVVKAVGARASTRAVLPKVAKPRARPARPAPKDAIPLPRRTKHAARPALDRTRKQLPDDERIAAEVESDAKDARLLSSARSGRDELRHLLAQHTEASPTLTAGDLDANWGDAYAVGDETPGGDNPTPDQDRVDDIGKALGVNYNDNEELKGSEKIIERDRHRWELDPASSDDWPHDGS